MTTPNPVQGVEAVAISKIRFAQQAGFIAKNAAAWAADCLDLIEDYPKMLMVDVARFTDDMRSRLDRIDEMAGRSALLPQPPAAVEPEATAEDAPLNKPFGYFVERDDGVEIFRRVGKPFPASPLGYRYRPLYEWPSALASPAPPPEQAEVERLRGERVRLTASLETAQALIDAAEAESAALKARVAVLVGLLDKQFGTPCEQIRHQQEIEAEREACAREADAFDQSPGDDEPMGPVMIGQVQVAQSIAAAIRARSARAGTDAPATEEERQR